MSRTHPPSIGFGLPFFDTVKRVLLVDFKILVKKGEEGEEG